MGRFVVGSSRSLAALGLLASMYSALACGSRAGLLYEGFSRDAGQAGAGGSASQPFPEALRVLRVCRGRQVEAPPTPALHSPAPSPAAPLGDEATDNALGDLDGDGDLDAVVHHQLVSSSRTSYSAVWFNEDQ
jgi:hypothetical protein